MPPSPKKENSSKKRQKKLRAEKKKRTPLKVETVTSSSSSSGHTSSRNSSVADDIHASHRLLNLEDDGALMDRPPQNIEVDDQGKAQEPSAHSSLGPPTSHFRGGANDINSTDSSSLRIDSPRTSSHHTKTSNEEVEEFFDKLDAGGEIFGYPSSSSSSSKSPSIQPSTKSGNTNSDYHTDTDHYDDPITPVKREKVRSAPSPYQSTFAQSTPAARLKNRSSLPPDELPMTSPLSRNAEGVRASELQDGNEQLRANLADLTARLKDKISQDIEKLEDAASGHASSSSTQEADNNLKGSRNSRENSSTRSHNSDSQLVMGNSMDKMTATDWKKAQRQIQFLEEELDKVTQLCVELTEVVEEEEKQKDDDEAPPEGDWRKAQRQIDYLEHELGNVSGLCTELTSAAMESADAIENLEYEKAMLEALIKRLEKALNDKQSETEDLTAKQQGVPENESTCWAACCGWIPEQLVWFVSYLYQVD